MDTSISSRDILSAFFRQKVKIFVFFICTFFFILIGIFAWPESYNASSLLLVKFGRESTSAPSVLPSEQQVLTFGVTKEQVNSEIEIILSNHLIEKTVDEIGVDHLFPEPEKPIGPWNRIKHKARTAVGNVTDFFYGILYSLNILKELSPYEEAISTIRKKLDVSAVKNSNVIKMELMWKDPVMASTIINTLTRLYMDYRVDLHKTPGALSLFDAETQNYKNKLTDLENRLRDFRQEWGIISAENQKRVIVDRISEIKKALQENQSEIYKTKKETEELSKQIRETSHIIMIARGEEESAQDKTSKEQTVVKNADNSLLKPTSPVIISELEKTLLAANVRLAVLEEEEKSLVEHLNMYNLEFQKLGEKEIELMQLEREFEIKEGNYKLYSKKLEEARISNVMDSEKIANVSIISFASPPSEFARPRKLLILLIGAFTGLFGGFAIGLYSEHLDHSIKDPKDVESFLALPLLASVKNVKK